MAAKQSGRKFQEKVEVSVTPGGSAASVNDLSDGEKARIEGRELDITAEVKANAETQKKGPIGSANRDQRRRLRRQGRSKFSTFKVKDEMGDGVVIFSIPKNVHPGLRRQLADLPLDGLSDGIDE